MKRYNIFKPGTIEYYRDALWIINVMAINFDGFKTAKGLKSLIKDMQDIAIIALKKDKLYLTE